MDKNKQQTEPPIDIQIRIDRLVLKNFRCFVEREFQFHPQFNCITGANASGKTALLEAIKFPLHEWMNGLVAPEDNWIRGAESDIRYEYFKRGKTDTYSPQFPSYVHVFGLPNQRQSPRRPHYRSITKLGSPDQSPLTTEDVEAIGRSQWLIHTAREAQKRVQAGTAQTLPCLVYYRTSRLCPASDANDDTSVDEMTLSDLSVTEGYTDALEATINIRRLRSWLYRQAGIAFEEGEHTELDKLVRQTMCEMLDKAKEVSYSFQLTDFKVTFENGLTQPFRQLSDGQRNLLGLAGDLAMRMARLNPHLNENAVKETPGIVLIDELDLHLHPEWQQTVVGNLKRTFPKIQFFVTTHSPFIIQALGEGEHFPLEGQPVLTPGKMGVEDIAEGLMGVKRADAGRDYVKKVEAAKDYLRLLDEAELAPEEKLEEYKRLLAEHLVPHADNPAYQALLELERVARLGA